MADTIIYTLIIAAVLALVGYGMQSGKKKEIELRQQSRNWPKTNGTVTGSELKKIKRSLTTFGKGFLPRVQSLNRYSPVIHYSYQVNGTAYQSAKFRNGSIAQSGEWFSAIPKSVEKILADYPQGKSVTVIYNPQNPAQAYLDLDTSIKMPLAYRTGGLVLIAGALLVLVLGGLRVGQALTAQQEVQQIPAAIPSNFDGIKNNLANNLNVTSCQADAKTTHAEKITYTIWTCTYKDKEQTTRILIYSRKDDPQKVDRVVAFPGGLDPKSVPGFYEKLSLAVAPSTDSAQVKKWLEDAVPAITKDRSKVETAFSGAKFGLNNENGLGASLEIGEAK